jgi:hypothetical protein
VLGKLEGVAMEPREEMKSIRDRDGDGDGRSNQQLHFGPRSSRDAMHIAAGMLYRSPMPCMDGFWL